MNTRKTGPEVRSDSNGGKIASTRRRGRQGRRPSHAVGCLEGLEPRSMLATFAVTSNADSGAGIYTPGELRWAIDQANTTVGTDEIVFQLPSGATTISLVDALDSIIESVVIDGTTQPGYLTAPIVAIDGIAVSDVGIRLAASASGSTVKALSVYGFVYTASNPDSGIAFVIDGSSDANEINGCFIGTDASSTTGIGNEVAGILVRGTNTTIRNSVISGNGGSGVILENDDGTTLTGNRIGTNRAGGAALTNSAHGILLRDSTNALIGGTTAASRNVISGNSGDGIRVEGATDAVILGNYLGVDAATGAVAVANGGAGISLDANNTTVGNGTVSGRNVIAGNDEQGVLIRSGSGTTIIGNFIGAAASGVVGAGNVLEGIRIDGGSGHRVGGTVAGEANVISDNGGSGITVAAEATTILIQQNLIGLGTTLAALGNGGDGISLLETSDVTVTYANRIAFNAGAGVRLTGASGNLIGADATRPVGERGLGFGNAIYANKSDGVRIEAESNDNTIAANLVGLATPNGAIQGNGGDGIAIQASRRNAVGGTRGTPVYANIVAGNVAGISISNSDAFDYAANGGDGNTVFGNEVRNNKGNGILVDDASFQTIGGVASDGANTITLNGGNGVEVRNGSRAIAVTGNFVGTNAAGILGFGNGGIGIRVLQSNASVIGGESGIDGNVIVGNAADGLVVTRVDDAGVASGDARENVVYGNTIRANKGSGIRITNASDNTIGKSDAGFGNLVGNNSLDGLRLETSADGNVVLGNVLGGPAVLGNGGVGVRIRASYENIVGSNSDGAANSIARNLGGGILIENSRAVDLANGNFVAGNVVDSNLGHGIQLTGSSFQTIGGALDLLNAGNTVIRNRGVGVRLTTDPTTDANTPDENLIQANYIGTNAAGTSLANTSHGIELISGSFNVFEGNTVARNQGIGIRIDGGLTEKTGAVGRNNTIGGLGDGQGNTIVANKLGGVVIENDARQNSVLGGLVDQNIGVGIEVRGSQNTRIGGGISVVRSTGDGILISSQRVAAVPIPSTGSLIEESYVGTNSKDQSLGNQGNGIRLANVAGVTVGSGVVAAYNRFAGVRIENSIASSLAAGNLVRSGEFRNNANGIVVAGSSFQAIGGTTDGFGNTVRQNTVDGIALLSLSRSITVQANAVSSNLRHGISLSAANDSTINGLNVITKNGSDGINVADSSVRNLIADNTVGDASDSTLGNLRDGIGLYAVNANMATANLVANNARHGVTISGAVAGSTATGNVLKGNRIASNRQTGVSVLKSRNQVIGGTGVDEANAIVLNKADGVLVGGLSSDVVVLGNLIGTDAAGADLGNIGDGIEVNNAVGTTIRSNDVRFNDANGVRISGVRGTAGQQTLVRANSLLANDLNGIQISASSATLVGGATNGNVIANNKVAGIRIDAASSGNVVEANTIGTDASGADLGNAEDGILITGALGNVVRVGNTISFNKVGVRILDAAATSLPLGNRVESNLVTLNDAEGVVVAGGTFHTIGGVNVGNTITLNGGDGVLLRTSGRNLPTGNLVRGNLIGTDASQAPLGNGGNGVRVIGGGSNVVDQNSINDNTLAGVVLAATSNNVIGSTLVGKANQLVGNGSGVVVTDVIDATTATTRGNVITGNTISYSGANGITVSGAKTVATVIGMTTGSGVMSGLGNAIRDNVGAGILLQNAVQQVSMQGNSIVDNAGGAILREAGTNLGVATPTIASVQLLTPSKSVAQLDVRGTLTGATAGQQYQLDVYSSRPEDGNGTAYGGRTYLGRATVTATANGTMSYSIQVPAGVSRLGDFVTVMATNLRPPALSSSAFSAGRAIVLASPAVSNATFAAIGAASASSTNSTSRRSRVVR
jgi:parallel beta-helix repeat protein